MRAKSSVDNFSFIMILFQEPPRQFFLLFLFALPYFMPYREQDGHLIINYIYATDSKTTFTFCSRTQCLFSAFAFYTLWWWKIYYIIVFCSKMVTYPASYMLACCYFVVCVWVHKSIFIHIFIHGFVHHDIPQLSQ